MARLSNAQVLMFVEIGAANSFSETISGWVGRQRVGQGISLIKERIAAHRGVVTHSLADTVFCSFSSAASALAAARELNEHFQSGVAASAPSSALPIGVSIAIAQGQLSVDGGRVEGEVVQTVTSMLDIAVTGQVLVAGTVREAAQGKGDFEFQEVRSSDFDQPLFRLRLPSDEGEQSSLEAIDIDVLDIGIDTSVFDAAMSAAQQGETVLYLTYGEQRFESRSSGGAVTVGRSHDNTLVVSDKHVSRHHIQFVWVDDGIELETLSPNGAAIRFAADSQERRCEGNVRLHGSGSLALAPLFSLAGSNVIDFRVDKA